MAIHKVAIVTDSTCDIPDELIEQYGIVMVPCFVIWGDNVLKDRVEMSAEEFYRRLEMDLEHPTTAHPTPDDFVSVYEAAIQNGAEEIIVLTVSSKMSGTLDAAQRAADKVEIPVHCVDAKGPTMSLGWQVLAAARGREAGGDVRAMLDAIEKARSTMVQYVCLDTLKYLHLGGRIGNATKFIGTLLSIKPLVYINHETGLVEPGERVRTRKRSLGVLYRRFFEDLDTSKKLRIAVLHGNALEDAKAIAERIRREFAPAELFIATTSPVLGVHTGPRAVALCGYAEG